MATMKGTTRIYLSCGYDCSFSEILEKPRLTDAKFTELYMIFITSGCISATTDGFYDDLKRQIQSHAPSSAKLQNTVKVYFIYHLVYGRHFL